MSYSILIAAKRRDGEDPGIKDMARLRVQGLASWKPAPYFDRVDECRGARDGTPTSLGLNRLQGTKIARYVSEGVQS